MSNINMQKKIRTDSILAVIAICCILVPLTLIAPYIIKIEVNQIPLKNLVLEYINNKVKSILQKVAPTTWSKTNDCYLDTIEAFPDELQRWEERNLKYVAYLVLAWDLIGFFVYFSKKLISNAIATRRVSS